MLKLERPGTTHEYVLAADRESERPTVFVLRTLTWRELEDVKQLNPMTGETSAKIRLVGEAARAEGRALNEQEVLQIHEITSDIPQYEKKLGERAAALCRCALVEIRGLGDQDGNEMDLKVGDFLERAPIGVLMEIGQEIDRITQLTVDERKNFDAPPVRGGRETTVASVH